MRYAGGFLVALVVAASGCGSRVEPGSVAGRPSPPDEVDWTVRAVLADLLKADAAAIPMDRPISDPPLKADDLDLVEIVMEIEERLGVEIADTAIEQQAGPLGKG